MTEQPPPPGAVTDGADERARRRRLLLLTFVLMLGLPLYLLAVTTVLGALTAPTPGVDGGVEKPIHWSVELLIYLVLGLVWVFPLKGLVKGIGRSPDGARR